MKGFDHRSEQFLSFVHLDSRVPKAHPLRPIRGMRVGVDKVYDTHDLVATARDPSVTAHVAQNITARRGSNIERRTIRQAGYGISQVIRERIEEANGWIKEIAGMTKIEHRGLDRVGWSFHFNAAAYDPVRMPNLMATG